MCFLEKLVKHLGPAAEENNEFLVHAKEQLAGMNVNEGRERRHGSGRQRRLRREGPAAERPHAGGYSHWSAMLCMRCVLLPEMGQL